MVKSLARRLTYRIMAVVLVMLAVITGIVYFSVGQYMSDEAQERYEGILQRDHEEFRRRLSDVMVAVQNNVHDIESCVDNPEMIIPQLERILQINPSIITCGIVYVPDYHPDKERCLELYASRDSAGVVQTGIIEDDYIVVMDRDWFRKGLEKDTAEWSEVYFENDLIPNISGRRQLTTYSTPVHNKQGQLAALFGADLSLEYLRSMMMDDVVEMNEKFEKGCRHHSYNFVIDHKGTYIIHPDEKRMMNSNIHEVSRLTNSKTDDDLVKRMMREEKGSTMLEIDGVPSWIYYRKVKHMDWVIAIVVPKEVIFRNGRTLNTIILLMMLIGMIAIYFICHHMIRQTTQPLHKFALSADEVALGNFSAPLPEIKGGDEVQLLHDAFLNMQESLKVYVGQLQETTTSKASLERELKIAHDIQMAMLPKTFPPYPERTDIDIYASETPAREVGGDLYDYFLRDNRLFFCIGDVSGKGMPAALFMAVMRSMFRSETRRNDCAADIVDTMNRNLSEEYTAGYFVTMFVGILDLTTGHLDYCNAGHEAPLVSGQPLPVKPNLPVGALADWNYVGQEARLQSGDMLFLYTDGLSEANSPTAKLFGRHRIQQLVSQHGDSTAQQLVQTMTEEVQRFAAEAEQHDDITLLAIRWNIDSREYEGTGAQGREDTPASDPASVFSRTPVPPHPRTSDDTEGKSEVLALRASMDDIGRLKPFVEQAATEAGITGKEPARLRLAVEEAVANVINYGQATTITLQTAVRDRQLTVTITDDGQPFDPTDDSPTDLSVPADQRPPGGMGIVLLHQMTDGLSYQRSDGHNILTLLKNI